MRIADVLRTKGAAVATITPETSVSGLLNELATHNIGAMVVVSADGLVGIVSERDVVRKLHEHGADLLRLPVSEIMTTMVATCEPSDTVNHLNAVMTTKRVRHIPVSRTASWSASSASATSSSSGWRSWRASSGRCRTTSPVAEIELRPIARADVRSLSKCWPGPSTTIR